MEPVLDGLRTVEVELLAEPEMLMARVYIRFALIRQKKELTIRSQAVARLS